MANKDNQSLRYACWALALIAIAIPAIAQDFHFGVKVGVPMTEYFQTSRLAFILPQGSHLHYSAATRRYTVGVSAEWRIKHGLGFEFDAVYKRIGYVRTEGASLFRFLGGNAETSAASYDVKGHSWEFPMMVKYRFGWLLRPFVAGGFVLRHIGPVRARGVMTEAKLVMTDQNLLTRVIVTTPIDTSDPPELQDRNFPGMTFGGGMEFGRGRLRLLPEFRYTRWTANISDSFARLRFEPNQAEFLLGFLF